MSGAWETPGGWLAHTAVGGGALLFIAWMFMRLTQQPARRQRLGELSTAAALLLAALCLAPAWLQVSLPQSRGLSPISTASQSLLEPPGAESQAGATSAVAEAGSSDGLVGSRDAGFGWAPLVGITPELDDTPAVQLSAGNGAPTEPTTSAIPLSTAAEGTTYSWSMLLSWIGGLYLLIGATLLGRWL